MEHLAHIEINRTGPSLAGASQVFGRNEGRIVPDGQSGAGQGRHHSFGLLSDLTALFIASSDEGVALASDLSEAGATVILCTKRHTTIHALWADVAQAQVIFIDADTFDDTGKLVDFCMKLRSLAPDKPTILQSAVVGQNDFTTERMSICDVTLSKPTSRAVLHYAIDVAVENNARYRALLCCQKDGSSATIEGF